MRVAIDRDKCLGHGVCYLLASEVFTDDIEGFGHLALAGDLPDGFVVAARLAAGSCPERAVSITAADERG